MLILQVNAVPPSGSVYHRPPEGFNSWPGRVFRIRVSADGGYEDFGFVHDLLAGFEIQQVYAPSTGLFRPASPSPFSIQFYAARDVVLECYATDIVEDLVSGRERAAKIRVGKP